MGKIVLVERGDCMFVDKARNLLVAGAIGGIVVGKLPFGNISMGMQVLCMVE